MGRRGERQKFTCQTSHRHHFHLVWVGKSPLPLAGGEQSAAEEWACDLICEPARRRGSISPAAPPCEQKQLRGRLNPLTHPPFHTDQHMHLQNDLTYSQVMMKWSCGDGEGVAAMGGGEVVGGGCEDQFHQENARVSKHRHRSAVLCHSSTYEKMCAARSGGGGGALLWVAATCAE